MMLEGYFDDSSDAQRSKFYVCGGIIGNSDQWDMFEAAWSIATARLTAPFRSADCEGGYGQFADWTKQERADLVKRLVEIIKQIGLHGCSAIVPIPEFAEVFPGVDKKEAFGLTTMQMIFNMAHLADRLGMDAALWFEQGPEPGIALDALKAVRALDWKPNLRIRKITFNDKSLRALQAADLIARESFKHVTNFGTIEPRLPVHELSDRLVFMRWTVPALKYMAQRGWPKEKAFLLSIDKELPEHAKLIHFWRDALRKSNAQK